MIIRKKIKASRRKPPGLTMQEFRDLYGRAEVLRVVRVAGTTYANFKKVATGHGNISFDLARKLEIASEGRMSAERIRPPKLPRNLRRMAGA